MNFQTLMAGITLMSLASGCIAAEPTRGFIIEHGVTAAMGDASIDAMLAEDENSLGARLGLGNAELLLSRDNVGGNSFASGAVLKVAINDVKGLAVYGGLSYFDGESDNDNDSYINFKVGAAFSVKSDTLELTVNPEIVFDDLSDDTYVNVGLGAFFDIGKTRYGTFKPGVEVIASSADDADSTLALGLRWEFNDRFVIDAIPVFLSSSDTVSLPGLLRVNLAF